MVTVRLGWSFIARKRLAGPIAPPRVDLASQYEGDAMTVQPRTPSQQPGVEQPDAGPDPMDDIVGPEGLPELPDESSTLEEPADPDESVEHIEEEGEPFDGNFA